MEKMEQCLAWLNKMPVPYTLVRHRPAYTMEDIAAFGVDAHGTVCKNLFLRNAKGTQYFLVSVFGDKPVNLKALGGTLGTRLSFASPQRLQEQLGLAQGHITPLAVLFNSAHTTQVLLDAEMEGQGRIGLHPCHNTATVFIIYADLRRLIESQDNPCRLAKL